MPRRAFPTIVLVVLLSLGTVAAQEPDETYAGFMHGIRANALQGDAVYQRDGATLPLEPGLELDPGDVIKSSPNAYAELLLQPGNYLRLGVDTELQIINDQHDRMRLKLIRGTINLEILSKLNLDTSYEARYLIRVITPNAVAFFRYPGIFRISATAGGQTDLPATGKWIFRRNVGQTI